MFGVTRTCVVASAASHLHDDALRLFRDARREVVEDEALEMLTPDVLLLAGSRLRTTQQQP